MKIALGSDHGGFKLKEQIKKFLESKGHQVKDFGTCSEESCDYPIFAGNVARAVSRGRAKRGILICKSGIGNSIVANKFPKVRAALCYDLLSARLSRQHNDANVLVLGSRFIKPAKAKSMISAWLKEPFEGGRHKRRVNQIRKIEQETRKGKK